MPIVAHHKEDVKAPGGGGGASSTFKVDERIPLPNIQKLSVGLGWDLFRKGSVDLDASCVVFDRNGDFMTSVYFGNLSSASCPALGNQPYIVHSGDNRDGAGEGDDETITCDLARLPAAAKCMVFCVTSYNGDPFVGVQSAKLRIVDRSGASAQGVELGHFALAAGGVQTALLMAKLYRDDAQGGLWYLHVIGQATEGRSFGDLLPLMQMQLKDIIPHVIVQPKPNVVVLTKGESMALGGNGVDLSHLMCGLGWDKMGDQPIDLDASCLFFDSKQNMIDVVFFNRLQNDNGSVKHAGDNLTGEGEGDDEKIFVDLTRVPDAVDSMFLTVNSYKGDPFSMIKNAYVRIVDTTGGKQHELVRFNLNGTGSMEDTALIMAKIYRYRDHSAGAGGVIGLNDVKIDGMGAAAVAAGGSASKKWMCKAIGYGGKGRMYKDNLGACVHELQGKLRSNPAATGFQYQPLKASNAAGGGGAAAAGAAAPAQAEGCCVIL